MSELSSSMKKVLKDHMSTGTCLELFPGHDYDSIDFLASITKHRVVALGAHDEMKSYSHLRYINKEVPPYPVFMHKFDYIFLNEAEWIQPENTGRPVAYDKFPHKTIPFIHRHLKKKFVITNLHKIVAKRIHEWLSHMGAYDFEYIEVGKYGIAIFTKK